MEAIDRAPTATFGEYWDRRRILAPVMIAPALIYIAALVGFPFVLAILYSLSDATTGNPSIHFVGLRNFVLFSMTRSLSGLWKTPSSSPLSPKHWWWFSRVSLP